MKYYFLLFLVLPFSSFAQQSTLSFEAHKLIESNKNNLQSISSTQLVHVIVKGSHQAIENYFLHNSGAVKYHIDDIFSVRLPLADLGSFAKVTGVEKIEIHQSPISVQDATAIEQTNVDEVHAGGGTLQRAYNGSGVVVGIIDSGIDPTHPDFKNDDGTTRILGFWDQNDFSGTFAPYGYGTAYTKTDIDAGAMSNYLDTTYDGHGTAVTGVAAGGGKVRLDVKGMAPEADIVVVGIRPSTLDYTDRVPHTLQIVDGINYIFKVAEAAGKPAVINISLGGIEGSHDGEDLPSQMIEKMLDEKAGRVLVTSAGNAGQVYHHVRYTMNNDTMFTWYRSLFSNTSLCKRDSGAYMSFYGDEDDFRNLSINVAAENRTPCCTADDETGFVNLFSLIGSPKIDTFKTSSSSISISTLYAEKIGNSYGVFVEIKSQEMSRFWRMQFKGTGTLDGWSGPLSRRSCNSDFLPKPVLGTPEQTRKLGRYAEPDQLQNIGTAYASSEKVVTVGAYSVRTEMRDVDSNRQFFGYTPLERASFSSIGPNRVGVIKPDITGPGQRIITAQPSQVLAEKAVSGRNSLYLGGQHSVTDGTSFSSPAVAGIIALYLEKNPQANYAEVLDALHSTADNDSLTGTPTPNNENGYGRVNAYQMLLYEAPQDTSQPVGVGLETAGEINYLVYPNPSKGHIRIEVSKSNSAINSTLRLLDVTGSIVLTEKVTGYQTDIIVEESGIYFVEITSPIGYSTIQKIVVQK